MLKVVGCFVEDHDLRLVLLAALICAVAAVATIKLLRHALLQDSRMRAVWLGVAAIAGGFGVWATHFVAMLAFSPDAPSGYDVSLTATSLALAIGATGVGLAVASWRGVYASIGGAIVGAGVAAMHFTGMAAFEIAGRIDWDMGLVAWAIGLGATLGAMAFATALRNDKRSVRRELYAAGLLVLAICSLHFTAMGALTITPDPRIVIPENSLPTTWIAAAVATVSLLILLLATAALLLDIRDLRRLQREAERMRSLSNASVEGLLVVRDGVIVNANETFAALSGVSTEALAGQKLAAYLPGIDAAAILAGASIEGDMLGAGGASLPVEILARRLDDAPKPLVAVAVRDLRARRKAESDIYFLAHHDPLTGIANRSTFHERLDRALESAREAGGQVAVLGIDLDRFKDVNDLFGHAAGDAVLRQVAEILRAAVPAGDCVARVGGDEFAVLATVANPDEAEALARAILRRAQGGLDQSGDGSIGLSIGVAIFPRDSGERETLLSYADMALYRAKHEGRGRCCVFEPAMSAELHDRRLLEHELRGAIGRGELALAFQPQMDVASGAIVGFEALARWSHPIRGPVSPALFIPLAEESGAILEIGEWVLRHACLEAAGWASPLTIAVNVSAVQLHSTSFWDQVHRALFETGLPAARLELEVTETALIRDLPRALNTLRRLKALGVRIAMDDFGTGYSSLSNLRAFPFDKIKIDASFVKSVDGNPQAAAIVRSVLGLGRGLGLPVLAEGVETEAEMTFLRAENCAGAQGYLFGRPGPIESFASVTGLAGAPAAGHTPPEPATGAEANSLQTAA
ncbi:bifunctional diguanylate cyclase/phosphodiesterase [Methylopila turkensis]|uniref:Diguanylate cyclase n=1 Tax=Methylopila turkensis TaxID=1437816 RepID=A0A9W6N6E1_9HYPH|nr:EAL domain-containing protein [Methylopila turkensis]GLK79241.1 diguanylate cyclase [Methylopila turkensis]